MTALAISLVLLVAGAVAGIVGWPLYQAYLERKRKERK